MRVRYTVPAQADLDDIYRYVSENNPFAAERIKRQIFPSYRVNPIIRESVSGRFASTRI